MLEEADGRPVESTMFFRQYYLNCLSHASYLIGDEKSGTAVVVDPQRDTEQYRTDACEQGLRIKYVILTHFHADFIAGHIELRDQVGATIFLGARAHAEFDFVSLKENDTLNLGEVELRVLETPGHTPEGISLLVIDTAQSPAAPHAVLTGDTLFIGDVGRPDLLASIGVTAAELSQMLYDSVHHKLAALPDTTLVYPAHGAGSLCGRALSDEKVSTIGEQKKYNYAMQPMSLQEFQELVLEDQPDAPAYFSHDAMLNRQERPALTESMKVSLQGLSLEATLRHQTRRAQLVDVRDAVDFEGAALKGAINIGLRGRFASWAGALLNATESIIVIAEPGEEEEAVMRLGRIGFDNVTGYLEGGMAAVGNRETLLQSVKRLTALDTEQYLQSLQHPLVIDVRTAQERAVGWIPHSVNIPLSDLSRRMDELGPSQPVIVHCQGGYRSAIACSLLQQHGFAAVHDLVGGFSAWEAASLPVEKLSPAGRGSLLHP